jgi:hypothetical protein
MKKIGIFNKFILPGCLALVGLFSSCSMFDDYLTVYPTNQITGEQFWEDKNDLTSVLASCYRQMVSSNVSQRMAMWGEVRSDNFILNSESNEDILNIMNANLLPTNSWFDWSGFYKGIGYCNLVLAKGEEVIEKDPSFNEGDWKPIAAECKALRALYYFYLVRAFRDVPFNVTSSDTSEGARDPMPQMTSQYILTYLINDLEGCKDDGMTNYGNSIYNRGRFTKNGIYALLADMYLWRAAKNSSPDSVAKYPGMAESDYQKCVQYCDYLIDLKIQELKKSHTSYWGSDDPAKTPYPIIEAMSKRFSSGRDEAYNEIFGEGNSDESIFELQFDGSTNSNAIVHDFYGYNNGSFVIGSLAASTVVQTAENKADSKDHVYSRTDLRMAESIRYQYSQGSAVMVYPIFKYLPTEIQVRDAENIWSQDIENVIYSPSNGRSVANSNWIIYRMSEIMLMRAEATASMANPDSVELDKAFDMVKTVFDRSNPMISTNDDIKRTDYATAKDIRELVMRERQREFYAEGKRWFDLVRIALREGSTTEMLNLLTKKYTSNASAIKAKLATLNSLYNPVYKEEMKVNPALVQNPAWLTDETIVRN